MPAWAARRGLAALALAAAVTAGAPAVAQLTDLVSRTAFRVCSDPANVPFSNEAGEGFENEIAEVFAAALDRELQYTWFPMAQGFVRRTLVDNRCDVIIGFAQGDELVLNTNHYYTSTHVLVATADGPLADVTTLADPRLQGKRLGIIAGSPPASHMARHGLLAQAKPYDMMVDRRIESPNEDMLADLVAGDIDLAVMWGPIGGPLAMRSEADLVVTPLLEEPGSPRLFYRITMGVRQGEDAWKRELNSLIRQEQDTIDAILRRHGVPLVTDMGEALKPEVGQ
jgi:quinoprotein dehydrogenase-associated probable ABC transporter substrate-binding protein